MRTSALRFLRTSWSMMSALLSSTWSGSTRLRLPDSRLMARPLSLWRVRVKPMVCARGAAMHSQRALESSGERGGVGSSSRGGPKSATANQTASSPRAPLSPSWSSLLSPIAGSSCPRTPATVYVSCSTTQPRRARARPPRTPIWPVGSLSPALALALSPRLLRAYAPAHPTLSIERASHPRRATLELPRSSASSLSLSTLLNAAAQSSSSLRRHQSGLQHVRHGHAVRPRRVQRLRCLRRSLCASPPSRPPPLPSSACCKRLSRSSAQSR